MCCRAATRASATAQPESVAVAGAEVMKVLRDGLARLQVGRRIHCSCACNPCSPFSSSLRSGHFATRTCKVLAACLAHYRVQDRSAAGNTD